MIESLIAEAVIADRRNRQIRQFIGGMIFSK